MDGKKLPELIEHMSRITKILRGWQVVLEKKLQTLKPTLLTRPVVIDFTDEEKLRMSQKAREYVAAHFSGQPVELLMLVGREKVVVDLDVCFWVGGEMRASAILAEGQPLAEALRDGVDRALHDGRFRPITEMELGDLRIELTFFGQPWRQLSTEEYQKNEIDPARGFAAVLDGRVAAWYIPAVHNVLAFRDLTHLADSLLRDKGRLALSDARRAIVYTFPTIGWIEGIRPDTIVALSGPIPASPGVEQTVENIFEIGLQWLFRQEVATGAFLPRRFAETARICGIDWPRLGFTASVLAEIDQSSEQPDCRWASRRIDTFLRVQLEKALFIRAEDKTLTALYAGLAALTADDSRSAKEWLTISERFCLVEKLSPIAQLQGATLLARLGGEHLGRAKKITEGSFRDWEKSRDVAQLALYPQLIPLCLELYRQTGERQHQERAVLMADWYVAQQQLDGSFPHSPKKNGPYIRGTGKIMEVLALFPERYTEALDQGFQYVARMQYTADSLYHSLVSRHDDFRGGFRHDAFNRDAWIDGTGHVLLAATRFLKHTKKR